MTFEASHCANFERVFEERKAQIAAFEGCQGVALKRSADNAPIYFTLSTWESEEALNTYRQSPLFEATWSTVKQWFAAKPEAWSLKAV